MCVMLSLILSVLAGAGPTGQIAYVSGATESDCRVVVMDVASRTLSEVGPGKRDGRPRWSPDGDWLAFDTETAKGRAVYVVGADGSEGRELRHSRPMNRDPVWSPDGLKIAYTAGVASDRQVVVYDIASDRETVWGGGRKRLVTPAWLARGLVVSLLAGEDRNTPVVKPIFAEALDESVGLVAIGLTEADGALTSDLFLVTATETVAMPDRVLASRGVYAEWRPAPARRRHAIAYESDDGGDREIFLYSRKGTWDLTNHRAADWNPVWGPKNDWLAFESFRSGRRGVYRVHLETARVYPVAVTERASNWWPTWSPDGEWIAFVSDRRGNPSLFIADLDDQNLTRLTDNASVDGAPAWRPKP